MQATSRNAERVLSSDALKLLVVIDVFLWFGMFIVARGKGVVDFSVLYTSGGIILEGHRAQLFDMQTQIEFQRRVLGMHALLPFNHLAYESLLFVPLALLPYQVALRTWQLLSMGMLLLSSRLLADSFRIAATPIFVLALSLFPVPLAISFGQDSILLLLLFSASLTALSRGHDELAGVFLALALFKPHLVLPLAAVLVWKRGVRFLKGLLAGTFAVLLVSVGITGLKGWREMQELMRYAAYGTGDWLGGVAKIRPNLRGFLALVGVGAHTAVVLTVIGSALLFILVAWRLRERYSPETMFSVFIAFALASSLYVNAHDLTLLLIPVLALLGRGAGRAARLCAGACFSFPLFRLLGYDVLFFLVMCAVLLFLTFGATREEATTAAAAH